MACFDSKCIQYIHKELFTNRTNQKAESGTYARSPQAHKHNRTLVSGTSLTCKICNTCRNIPGICNLHAYNWELQTNHRHSVGTCRHKLMTCSLQPCIWDLTLPGMNGRTGHSYVNNTASAKRDANEHSVLQSQRSNGHGHFISTKWLKACKRRHEHAC